MVADHERESLGGAQYGVFHDNNVGAKLDGAVTGIEHRTGQDAAVGADRYISDEYRSRLNRRR
jgi:hypothetical protein